MSIEPLTSGAKNLKSKTKKRAGVGKGDAGLAMHPALALAPPDVNVALRALKAGDFGARMLPGLTRASRDVALAFNDVASMLDGASAEFARVSRVVGRDGEMTERAELKGALGGWSTQVESFNALIGDLVRPSTEVGPASEARRTNRHESRGREVHIEPEP